MSVRVADVMGLISDLIDFFRSVHEALTERRRKSADKAKETASPSDRTPST